MRIYPGAIVRIFIAVKRCHDHGILINEFKGTDGVSIHTGFSLSVGNLIVCSHNDTLSPTRLYLLQQGHSS